MLSTDDPETSVDRFFSRLKGSNADRELSLRLLQRRKTFEGLSSRPLSFRKRRYADPDWQWLAAFGRAKGFASEVEWCELEKGGFRPEEIDPPPLIDGDDLTSIGLKPGPPSGTRLRPVTWFDTRCSCSLR